MADRKTEKLAADLVDRFEELGLTGYEARTLVALARLETATAREVAEVDDVPRTRVYDAAETLHELGLVDIKHSSPQQYTIISRESIVRKLDNRRENVISEIGDLIEQLVPAETRSEEFGVWTVTGREAVSQRLQTFIDDADDRIVYMTVDELLTETDLECLRAAEERGVSVHLAGISETVQERIQDVVPAAELFETLWEWSDTPAGSLLIADDDTALVSVRVDDGGDGVEETAIWGSGQRNSLVVVLRSIFAWRLGAEDLPGQGSQED